MSVRLVDSHAHVHAAQFDADRDAVLARAAAAGVELIIAPATDVPSAEAAIGLARRGLPVAPAVGIHPGSLDEDAPEAWRRIGELARQPEVVAIGETGLDYYRDKERAAGQRALFMRHLALAAELDLPVVVHNREADEDVLRAIADFSGLVILHCFVGPPALAERALSLGCYLGFGGPVTFKNARDCHESARIVPMDRVLVETDSPYLAPTPHRGGRNEPAHVRLVAERLAELRGTTPEEVALATTENAGRVFSSRVAAAR